MENPKIVYVEDEEDYRLLVSHILADAGLSAEMAETGTQGLRLLEQTKPDLLLLDVQLPDIDGFSLCRQLRQNPAWKDLPILMLTVLRRPEQWRNGFSCGATDYVSKPLNPPEFIDRVQACLKGTCVRPILDPMDAEYQMIQASLAGNQGVFDVLVRQYRAPLLRTITQLVRNTAEAEDIVSSALMIALERLKEYRGESSFSTWLYGIALNQMHSRWRTRATFPLQSLSAIEQDYGPADDPDVRQLEHQPDLTRIKKAISAVPRPYRTVLTWNLIEGLSYEAMARRWGVPVGTVSKRMATAKQRLRVAWNRLLWQPKELV